MSIFKIAVNDIRRQPTTLAAYAGKTLLVVNVASKCGLTPQYTALQKLYDTYNAKGLVVLGFPCNQFKGQEPGTEEEIKDFCTKNYNVTFPVFGKLDVFGENKHELYKFLTAAQPVAVERSAMAELLQSKGIETTPEPEVVWNFEKFLVGKDGEVIARFGPKIAPDDEKIITAIEKAL